MAHQLPIFIHQLDVVRREAVRKIDFPVRDASVHQQLTKGPAIDENEEERATALDTLCVENGAAMVVQIQKRGIAAVRGAKWTKSPNFAFRQPGCLLDENITTRPGMDGLRESISVVGVGRDMDTKDAMPASFHRRREREQERDDEKSPHGRLIKNLTVFATFAVWEPMRLTLLCATLIFLGAITDARAQEKRTWFSRVMHPFGSSEKIPEYKNPKLRGLILAAEIPQEPVKLSEVRQLPVRVTLTNRGAQAVELNFPTEQRIEILLHDSSRRVVTRWSDNRAFAEQPGTLLINPGEHVEYSETIATRELTPGKVFTVEVTVPAFPELDAQRKSIAAP